MPPRSAVETRFRTSASFAVSKRIAQGPRFAFISPVAFGRSLPAHSCDLVCFCNRCIQPHSLTYAHIHPLSISTLQSPRILPSATLGSSMRAARKKLPAHLPSCATCMARSIAGIAAARSQALVSGFSSKRPASLSATSTSAFFAGLCLCDLPLSVCDPKVGAQRSREREREVKRERERSRERETDRQRERSRERGPPGTQTHMRTHAHTQPTVNRVHKHTFVHLLSSPLQVQPDHLQLVQSKPQ